MKNARFILKIVGASLFVAGIVCLIIGFWDRLIDAFRPEPPEDYEWNG